MVKKDLKKGKKFVLDEKCEKLFQLVRKGELKQTVARKKIDAPKSTFSEQYNKWLKKTNNNP